MLVGTMFEPSPTAAAPAISTADIVDEFVAGGNWTGSVSADFLPDGRLLTITTAGNVYLVNPATSTSTQLFTLPGVLASGEAGLLDIAADPDFATNSRFYTYSSELSSRRLRVDRFTLAATGSATLASRTPVWINPGPSMGIDNYHIGGSLNFGPDGMLYLSTGDNLVGGNSQLLTNVFGKVLRFAPDGTVPTDNPFYDGSGPNIDEIYAIGIRNGFRSSFDRTTGEYWMGDVGGNNASTAYEEVDLIQAGANYGWPVCEGPLGQPKNGANCPSGITGPLYSYSHDIGGGCCQNRSITGGEIYRGSAYPASFEGTYVYADYATRAFYWMERNGSTATSGELKRPSLANGTPVWVGVSPADGAIYWMHYGFGDGQIRRLRYTGTLAHPPTVTQATATPTSGPAPLTVTFAASATDLDGDAVSYHWDFGDGTSADVANPTRTYDDPGVYTAQLTVTANGDTATGAPISIQVGEAPTATITAPTATTFRAGDTIVIEGSATDPDDGPLPADALAWNIVFRHDDHTHPVATGAGSSITLPVPSSSGHSWEGATGYRITLTATDSNNLTDTEVLELDPIKTAVAISADAPVNITIDGITEPLPSVLDTAVGARHVISAPAEACVAGVLRTFAGWSSGAARTHTLTAVEDHPALTATYASGGPCGPTLYRAVNINGRALVIDGVAFEDGLSAPDFSSGPAGFCDQSVPLVPPPSAEETEMIRCSTYGFGNAVTTMTNVPNGSYTVEYWVWEDNDSETFTPSINGVLQPTITSGGAGAWQKVGPVPVAVTSNQIQLSAIGGASNFSGIRVWQSTPQADTTPPSVVSVTPAGGASGVATGTTVTVNFTEPVNANGGVTLAVDGGATVPTTATATGSALTLVPAGPLSPGTTYRVSVSTAVSDLAGNPLTATTSSTFTTAAAPPTDTTAPTVVSVLPASGASDLPTSTTVSVTFSEPVAPNGGISLAVDGGAAVPTTATVSGNTVTLTPSGPLGAGTAYRLNVTTAVRDLAGNPLASGSFTTFTTGAAPANTELKVSRSSTRGPAVPLAGNTWAPGEQVYVFLDVTTPAVAVRFHLDTPITAAPVHNESLSPWDFNGGSSIEAFPYVNGLSNGSHTITAVLTRTDGGTDVYSATFTVGTAPPPPDTTPPVVNAVTPANGATGVPTSATPAITFSEPVDAGGGVTLTVDGGGAVTATASVSGNTVTLTPSAPLATATTYRVSVSTAVRDLAGNPLAAASSTTFTTAAAPPPPPGGTELKVSRSASRAPAVPLSGNTWTPGEQVYVFLDVTDPAVGVRFFLDTPVTGPPVRIEGAAPWDFGGGGVAAAFPYTNFLADGSHTVSAVLTRPDGTTATYSATFTVGTTPPPPDTTAPTLVTVSPASGATGVATGTTVTVTFSEPVLPNGGISLAVDGGAPVPATIATSANSVIVTPSQPLAASTVYRVAVSGAVQDLVGNPLAAPSSTTFTTAAAPPVDASLKVSRAAARSPAVPLAGATWTVGEQVYVFLDVTTPAVSVRFFLDTPTTGSPFRIENLAPWDFGGGATATANPFANNLSRGTHTISAVLTRSDGTTVTYTATFTVA